ESNYKSQSDRQDRRRTEKRRVGEGFDMVRSASRSLKGCAARARNQIVEICTPDSNSITGIEIVAQWWSPDAVGINRLVVGSNPTAGANFMFWVYILQNPDGNFYVGHTDKLENRITNHNRTDKIA